MLSQCLVMKFEIKTLGRLKNIFLQIEMVHSIKEFSYFNRSTLLSCLKKQEDNLQTN